jgi:transposase
MKFEDIYELRTEGRISAEEAASMLGMSSRNLRRYIARYKEEGLDGLNSKRLGKAAHNAAPVDEVMAMVELYRSRYEGYSAAHFYDKYCGHHGGQRSYNWVREGLQKQGAITCRKKQGSHRLKRPRCPMEGMRIHQDGSTHEWVAGEQWDLIVTMDDATNEIYSAFFVEEEGTLSSFRGMKEVIETKGLPSSFYSDRGSHYWYTDKGTGKVDKARPTQFGRAMQQLGIDMIAAYSPQARGRSERMFGTLQQRLPKELASEGITTMAQANQFLKETFLPEFNQRFTVKAQEEGSAFVRWRSEAINLDDILCLQQERIANKDNTISYQGKRLQIPPGESRYSYAKTKIKVCEHSDGSIALFHGPRCLVRFEASVQADQANQTGWADSMEAHNLPLNASQALSLAKASRVSQESCHA